MKYLITSLVLLNCFGICAQTTYKKIELNRKGPIQSKVDAITNLEADRALRAATYLFCSKEFQDSIAKLTFPADNYCNTFSNAGNRKDNITGQVIFKFLFSRDTVSLKLTIEQVSKKPVYRMPAKENICYTLGITTAGVNAIKSYYENINCDMGADLPFSSAYAVHICHEYMHAIGFCHTTHKVETDVADAVGWIAYHFIKKWTDDKDPDFLAALNKTTKKL